MATTTITESNITTREGTIKTIKAAGTPIYRVLAQGHIIYDRKDYVLTAASDYRYIAPITGGTIIFPSTAITSTYSGYDGDGVRVNNAPIGYTIGPASLPSRAHNTQWISGNTTVVQDESQLSVPVPYYQPGDAYEEVPVPTGLTVYITNVATIPASGGSVNTATLSVTANGYIRYDWLSGDSTIGPDSSWTVSSSDYSVAWTGVTASSKETSITHQATSAGTLYCQVTYSGVTGNANTTVYQAKNEIRGYTEYTYNLIVETNITGTYTSAGGNVDVEYTAQRSRKPIYDSNATGATITTDAAAELACNIGTITPYSVSGVGVSVLAVPANTTQLRTITIVMNSVDDPSKTATTSFNQYASSYSYAYSYLSNYTGNGIITDWSDVRQVSETIQNWSTPSQAVYQVSADGEVKYRIGTSASSQLVARDTYFMNLDNLLFKTRVVTTAGDQGTEYLYYKNNNWIAYAPSDVDATATTFTITGTTNTSYGVVVKYLSRTIASAATFTGSLVVPCSANTSTYSTRVFTVTFTENNPSAANKPEMQQITVTQAKKVAPSISIDHNTWTYECGPLNSDVVIVNAVAAGWYASYDANYFSVSPASGDAGSGQNVVVTALQRGTTSKDINFQSNELSGGRARYTVSYEQC